jgi:hypothetical protein
MVTQNFDSIENGSLPAGWFNYLGTHEVQGGALVCTSRDSSNGAFTGVNAGSAISSVSVDITPDASSTSPFGLFLRYVDLDNHVLCHVISSTNRIRLVEVVNGSNTVLGEVTPSGYTSTQTRTMAVEDDGLNLTVKLDGAAIGISEETTVGQGSTIAGVRSSNVGEYSYDNFTHNTASSASKTVTFSLPDAIQGVSGVNYILTPNPLGDSITSGILDTSGATVTIDLDAFPTLTAGDNLLMIATDKQAADDNTDIIAWDASTVVEV